MVNTQGGKKYKSGKGHQEVKAELHEIGPDQMVGRVIRNLGQRRLLIYCNDDVQRVCKIRGGLRKKVWFAVADIVLISVREIGNATSSANSAEKGDVLAKYEPAIYAKLRKEKGINAAIFTNIENSGAMIGVDEGDNFEFDHSSSGEEDGAGADVDIDAI
jgi:translation initiation factor 1A